MLSTKTRQNRNDKQWLCRHCRTYFWTVRPPGRPQKYPRYECPQCHLMTGPPLPMGELHKILWKIVSESVRRRDADENGNCSCVTEKAIECPYTGQRLPWYQFQAGHYLGGRRQSAAGILYDKRGIHAQCAICNGHYHGQQLVYHQFMVQRYGIEVCADLEYKKRQPHRWVRSEMEDAILAEADELNVLRVKMGDTEPMVVHI